MEGLTPEQKARQRSVTSRPFWLRYASSLTAACNIRIAASPLRATAGGRRRCCGSLRYSHCGDRPRAQCSTSRNREGEESEHR